MPTAAWCSTPDDLRAAARRARPRRAPGPRARPSPTSGASPRRSARHPRPPASRRASRSSGTGARSTGSAAMCPGGTAPYPSSLVMTVVPARVAGVGDVVVASPADRERRASTPSSSAPPACSRSMPSSSRAAPRPSARSPSGSRRAGSRRSTGSSGRATPGSPPRSSRSRARSGSTCRPGPSEGMVLAASSGRSGARRRGSHHPGRARPRFAGHPRHDRRCVRRRRRGGRRPARWPAPSGAPSSSAPSPPTAPWSSPPTSRRRSTFVNAYAPEHLSVDVEPLEETVGRLRNAGSVFVGPWAPESAGDYATGANHVLPTGGLARACGPLAVEAYGKFSQVQRISREGLAGFRDDDRHAGHGGGPPRPPRGRRDPVPRPGQRAMSPTPVTFSSPTAPASYSWEATDEEVAARYGVPIEQIVRFDLNTSPAAPELAGRVLAAGTFETGLSEYPPSDYRRLVAAAAARYGVAPEELLVGAGADEILDLVGKAFLPRGRRGRDPDAHLRDVPRHHRAARRPERGRARAGCRRRLGAGPPGGPRGRAGRRRRLAVQPEQPDRPARTRRGHRNAPRRSCGRRRRGRARGAGRGPRRGLRGVRRPHAGRPRDAAIPACRDPDRQQGLCPGRASRRLCDRSPGDDRARSPRTARPAPCRRCRSPS